MLVDDGLVQRDPDGSLVIGDLETISVPPTIQALLAARLDRLSDGERRTIERASVVGQGVRPARRLRAHARPRAGPACRAS